MKQYIVEKQYSDKLFEEKNGKFFGEKHYDHIFKEEVDVYYKDSNGNLKILVKLRKNIIPKTMRDKIRLIFEKHAKHKNNQRAKASGGKRITTDTNNSISNTLIRSNIVGYYDKPRMIDKKYFKTSVVCRTTAFTRDNFNDWENSLPFFKIISRCYKELAPIEYSLQTEAIKKSPFQILDTPFTTVTVNYNWRTACHKDKGDYSQGLGNLTVLGNNFNGGYLGFPQFKIAVDVQPGDMIIMNVHEWHCNTELILNEESARLSFVCYMREDMTRCNKKKIVDGEVMYYKG